MKPTEPSAPPADILADIQAVAKAAAAGIPVDLEVARRVRERSKRVQEDCSGATEFERSASISFGRAARKNEIRSRLQHRPQVGPPGA
jgi:hypothetical protein